MELDAVLRERRSMRKYQPDRKVSREQVEEILKAATLAPSWKNSQTARYYVVMSDDMLKNVKETCLPSFNQTNCKDAPVLIVATFVKNRSGYDNDGTPSNELGNGWGCYDLGMHNQNLLLKAKDLGSGHPGNGNKGCRQAEGAALHRGGPGCGGGHCPGIRRG